MNKKIILISIAVFLVLILLVGGFLIRGKTQNPSATSTTNNFPVSSQTQTSTTNSLTTVKGADGNTILTTNFLESSTTAPDPVNKGYYYLGYNTFTQKTNVPYMIEYIASTQYFNIELLQEPLSQTRQDAEDYLIHELGITQAQMCNLNYTIETPDSVNTFYASENLGFSFCPGATKLP